MESSVCFASPVVLGLSPAEHSLMQRTSNTHEFFTQEQGHVQQGLRVSQTHHHLDSCLGPSCPSGRCLGQCSAGIAVLQHSLCFRSHHKGFAPASGKKAELMLKQCLYI